MSDVIILGSIEMYGLVTVWTSMDDGPYWVILLMYGSHDMRHTSFRWLTMVNGTPGFWGVTSGEERLGERRNALRAGERREWTGSSLGQWSGLIISLLCTEYSKNTSKRIPFSSNGNGNGPSSPPTFQLFF